jgi:hypothetical protein
MWIWTVPLYLEVAVNRDSKDKEGNEDDEDEGCK